MRRVSLNRYTPSNGICGSSLLAKAQFYGLGNAGDFDAAVLSIGFERLLTVSRPD
jgi:hypothetical protein